MPFKKWKFGLHSCSVWPGKLRLKIIFSFLYLRHGLCYSSTVNRYIFIVWYHIVVARKDLRSVSIWPWIWKVVLCNVDIGTELIFILYSKLLEKYSLTCLIGSLVGITVLSPWQSLVKVCGGGTKVTSLHKIKTAYTGVIIHKGAMWQYTGQIKWK